MKRLAIVAVLVLAGLFALGWHYYGGYRVSPAFVAFQKVKTDVLGSGEHRRDLE